MSFRMDGEMDENGRSKNAHACMIGDEMAMAASSFYQKAITRKCKTQMLAAADM
jgi:hypothetical protein